MRRSVVSHVMYANEWESHPGGMKFLSIHKLHCNHLINGPLNLWGQSPHKKNDQGKGT
jgi:hypothetical protein